jgi:DNA-directed RNA polymerase specialized sigma24 family protein
VRFALMLVGDQATAEDIVQEAFLSLYRAGAGCEIRTPCWGTCVPRW